MARRRERLSSENLPNGRIYKRIIRNEGTCKRAKVSEDTILFEEISDDQMIEAKVNEVFGIDKETKSVQKENKCVDNKAKELVDKEDPKLNDKEEKSVRKQSFGSGKDTVNRDTKFMGKDPKLNGKESVEKEIKSQDKEFNLKALGIPKLSIPMNELINSEILRLNEKIGELEEENKGILKIYELKNSLLVNEVQNIESEISKLHEGKKNIQKDLEELQTSLGKERESFRAQFQKFDQEKISMVEEHEILLENLKNDQQTEMETRVDYERAVFCNFLHEKTLLGETLNNKISGLNELVKQLQLENQRVAEEHCKAFGRIKELLKELEEKEGDMNDLNLRIKELEEIKKVNGESIEFLNKENFTLNNEKRDFSEKNKIIEGVLNETKQALENAGIKNLILGFNSIKENVTNEIECLSKENEALAEKLKIKNEEKVQQDKFYQSKLKDLDEKSNVTVRDLMAKVSALNEELIKTKEERTSQKIQLETIENERNDFKAELTIKSQYVKELETSMTELEKYNTYFQNQLLNADKTIQELKSNRLNLNFALELEKINKKHKKEIALLKLEIEELQRKH